MKPITCRQFEERAEEWVAGTLADFERAAMREHAERCPACREEWRELEAIIGAARAEGLDLPGDAYFEDLGWRLERDLEDRGLLLRGRPRMVRPAPLLSQAQRFALLAAAIALGLWVQGTTAMLERPESPAERQAALLMEQAASSGKSPSVHEAIKKRDRKIEEIFIEMNLSGA